VGISFLFRYLKPYRKQCILGPAFKLTEAVLELFLPLMMAKIIDVGVVPGDSGYVLRMCGLMLLVVIVGFGCAIVCQYMASVASQGFGTVLRNALMDKVLSLSDRGAARFGTSSLVNRVTSDVNQLQFAVAMLIRLVIRAPFLCVGGIIMAMFVDAKLALVLVAAVPVVAVLIVLIMRANVKLHRSTQKQLDKMALVLRENLSGLRVIRAFARSEQEKKRFSDTVDAHTSIAARVGRLSALLNPGTQLVMNFAVIAIIWFGGIRIQSGDMSLGEITAFINYVGQIVLSLIVVANLVITFTKAYASAGRVTEVLRTKSDMPDGNSVDSIDADADAVVFSQVYFSYDENDGEDELSDISFTIPRGARVGIIGGTGSGKTTIVNLIMRFYFARCGEIKLFGHDVRDYSAEKLRELIALSAQKVELFSGTVADNIRWGDSNASDDDVRTAAVLAQADEFIKSYDSPVERGGANLSGGQRQRLAIARAVLRRPRLLILDDSSSALDYATAAALRRDIDKIADGTTVITVSQRVSAVQSCDIILVMDDGTLAGSGTHAELLAGCELYREICALQNEVYSSAKEGITHA